MDGILPVYKPAGMTSAAVVARVRWLLHMKKVGHSGTLDPSVDGVLPIALGAATKAVPALMSLGKVYTGSVILGFATETEDLDGAETSRKRLEQPFTDSDIDAALASLTGEITQTPPMYSAVKVNGRRLYEYARAGQVIDRPSRQVTVHRFVRKGASQFDAEKGEQRFSFEAAVSKGTYIRTLAVDAGRKLAVPAVMAQLTRIQSGGFALADTLDLTPLDRDTAPKAALAKLQPIQFAYPDLTLEALTDAQWAIVQHGNFLTLKLEQPRIGLTYQGNLKAIYQLQEGQYRPETMFLTNEGAQE